MQLVNEKWRQVAASFLVNGRKGTVMATAHSLYRIDPTARDEMELWLIIRISQLDSSYESIFRELIKYFDVCWAGAGLVPRRRRAALQRQGKPVSPFASAFLLRMNEIDYKSWKLRFDDSSFDDYEYLYTTKK